MRYPLDPKARRCTAAGRSAARIECDRIRLHRPGSRSSRGPAATAGVPADEDERLGPGSRPHSGHADASRAVRCPAGSRTARSSSSSASPSRASSVSSQRATTWKSVSGNQVRATHDRHHSAPHGTTPRVDITPGGDSSPSVTSSSWTCRPCSRAWVLPTVIRIPASGRRGCTVPIDHRLSPAGTRMTCWARVSMSRTRAAASVTTTTARSKSSAASCRARRDDMKSRLRSITVSLALSNSPLVVDQISEPLQRVPPGPAAATRRIRRHRPNNDAIAPNTRPDRPARLRRRSWWHPRRRLPPGPGPGHDEFAVWAAPPTPDSIRCSTCFGP
jgi:hypothetical protein